MANKSFIPKPKCTYSQDGKSRKTLLVDLPSGNTKKAVVIGINPSKANDSRSDKTITTLARYLDRHCYGQFTMLNLFESYSTDQCGIIPSTCTNFSEYEQILSEVDHIIIAWGVSNRFKAEKAEALKYLDKYNSKLMCIENNAGSRPMHPSRIGYAYKLVNF